MSCEELANKKNEKLMELSPKSGVYDPVVADETERDALFTGNVKDGFKVRIESLGVTQEWNNGQAQWDTLLTTGNPPVIGMQETYDVNPGINLYLNNPIEINTLSAAGDIENAYTATDGTSTNLNDRVEGFTFVPVFNIKITAVTYPDIDFILPGTREIQIYRKSDEVLMLKGIVDKTDALDSGFRVNTNLTIITSDNLQSGIEYVSIVVVPGGEEFLSLPTTTNSFINVIETASGPDTSTPQFPTTFNVVGDVPSAGGFQFKELINVQNYVFDNDFYLQRSGSTAYNSLFGNGQYIIFGSSGIGLLDVNYNTNRVRFNGITEFQNFMEINTFITHTKGSCVFNATQNALPGTYFRIDTNTTANAVLTDFIADRTTINHELRISDLAPTSLVFSGLNSELLSTNLIGDATTSANVLTLATVNPDVGTFGNDNNAVTITANGKGQITAISEVPINFPIVSMQAAYDGGNSFATDDTNAFTVQTPVPTFGAQQVGFQGGVAVSSDGVPTIYGWQFQITKRIRVTALGYVDSNFTLGGSRDVVIYNYVGLPGPGTEATPIATVLKTDPLINGRRFKDIAPTILEPGFYVVAATVPAGENHFNGDTQVTSPDIIPVGYAFYNNSATLIYPASFNTSPNQLIAGDMLFEAEELVDTDAFSVDPVSNTVQVKRDLDLNNNSLLNVYSTNNLTPFGGVFTQTVSGTVISNTVAEVDLLGAGLGSLEIPANMLNQGSFVFDIMGGINSVNGDTLTIRLKSNGTIDLGVYTITLPNATMKAFTIAVYFTVREIGIATVAALQTFFEFNLNQNASNSFEGDLRNFPNTTTFDTTISNTLSVTAQFNVASTSNSIQSRMSILRKIF